MHSRPVCAGQPCRVILCPRCDASSQAYTLAAPCCAESPGLWRHTHCAKTPARPARPQIFPLRAGKFAHHKIAHFGQRDCPMPNIGRELRDHTADREIAATRILVRIKGIQPAQCFGPPTDPIARYRLASLQPVQLPCQRCGACRTGILFYLYPLHYTFEQENREFSVLLFISSKLLQKPQIVAPELADVVDAVLAAWPCAAGPCRRRSR